MSESSYIIGNSYNLATLTEQERKHLDTAKWVFTCNSFLSHWEVAGFRPTVWAFGDNHSAENVADLDIQLAAFANDTLLQQRIRHAFAAAEQFIQEVQDVARRWCVPIVLYRRGQPWQDGQQPAKSLDERIYHYGSTFTDLVNLAWILNPDAEIRLFGNEWGDGFGHFWEGRKEPRGKGGAFWQQVKATMWEGLHELRYRWGLPLIDCNQHPEGLPGEYCLPTGRLLD